MHDQHLMQTFLQANITEKDLRTLNNCRLYLQVTTLAEITDHKGIKILEEVLHSGK